MDKLKGIALSDTGFAFDPMTGHTYSLNKTGIYIVRRLKEGKSPEEIVQDMVNDFEVDEGRAREDLSKFLEVLKGYGLI